MKIQSILLSLLIWGSPTLAERVLEFAPYEVPASGALIVPVSESGELAGAALAIDRNIDGALKRALGSADFEAKSGETMTLFAFGPFTKLGLVGIGDEAPDRNGLRDFGGSAARLARDWKDDSVSVLWGDARLGVTNPGSHIAFGAALGQYQFARFKSEVQEAGEGELKILVRDPQAARAEYAGQWAPVARAVRFARDLVRSSGQ